MKKELKWVKDGECDMPGRTCKELKISAYRENRETLGELQMPPEARCGWYVYPRGHELMKRKRGGRIYAGPFKSFPEVMAAVARRAANLALLWDYRPIEGPVGPAA